MKTKLLSCLCAIICNVYLLAEPPTPPSILIIGGGPAGLATAIEAKASGCNVTVVEKRDSYSRHQWLFLVDSSLKLLEKWNVHTPQMKVADTGDGNLMGFVPIRHLEEQLQQRAQELGVQIVYGEFQGFGSNRDVIVTSQKNALILPYDILVGADGAHSDVREALAIKTNHFGSAVGVSALIPGYTDGPTAVDISPAMQYEDGFLRRIKVPSASIVFIQFPFSASKGDLQKTLEAQGWSKEAQAVSEKKAFVIADIPVSLQQAHTFSSAQKSAILVGEAAATASFFQGMGANTALKTAEVAGRFFHEVQADKETAFQNFNRAVKGTTDAMIEDSAFLFSRESLSSK